MPETFPPGLVLAAGAAFLPFFPRPVRRWVAVLAPALAWVALSRLPSGEAWTADFLGYRIVWLDVDRLGWLFALVFLWIALLGGLYGWHRERLGEVFFSLLYAAGGVSAVLCGDLLSLLVSWEVMAVSSAFLVFSRARPSAWAAGFRYLLVHAAAGGFLLVGVLAHVLETGSTELAVFSPASTGGAFLLLSFCINAAVPPLHAWLPDAYPEGTVSGSVFLSALTTKTAVYCLLRCFPGSELLVWAGAVMALYGVVFAVLENDTRRLLSYHIVSQVGYMVCGVGLGTPLGLNGAAAHAFCHILYKGLLFMGAGALLYRTGRERLTELGGLFGAMPLTFLLYMVGAFSISGVPLFNGFVSKSMVVAAAAEEHRAAIVLLLQAASVGTFLSVGLKLPYFAWFGPRRLETPPREAPRSMLLAMGVAAGLCIGLGLDPEWLYERLPFPPVHYHPYTAPHVFEALLLLGATALAFESLRGRLAPKDTVTLDTDVFYRIPARWLAERVSPALEAASRAVGEILARLGSAVSEAVRNPALSAARIAGIDPGRLPAFDPERPRMPLGVSAAWLLVLFGILGAWLLGLSL
ncbi:MAG: Na(+)/H(+) antiporter subunit D [Candidatus Binatia bacterium]|nr:MAG: Na(+)/H(+) antiporter subunit D [Candidatus Binatia bacterium]